MTAQRTLFVAVAALLACSACLGLVNWGGQAVPTLVWEGHRGGRWTTV